MRYAPHSASSLGERGVRVTVTGSVTMPASERLTRSTWWAWSSIERLRCSTPMPPWRAIAIAIRASVTVSIAADSSGTRDVDLAGEPGGGVDLDGHDVGLRGQQQDVVEGQAERGEPVELAVVGSSVVGGGHRLTLAAGRAAARAARAPVDRLLDASAPLPATSVRPPAAAAACRPAVAGGVRCGRRCWVVR